MSDIPSELLYTKSHEWVRDEGDGSVTIGITDHAQELLGDLVFVELPNVGDEVEAGADCAVVESVKAASDVYSPLPGEIVAVNEALAEAPEAINESPYAEGWLFRLKLAEQADLGVLLDADAYRALEDAD